jgi:opacity protein-like surface antigen
MQTTLITKIALLLIVSFVIGTQAVHAQDTNGNFPGISNRLKVSVGALAVDSAETRNRTSATWPLLSISYDLAPPKTSRALDFAVYAEGGTDSGQELIDLLTIDRFTRSVLGVGLSSQLRLTPPGRSLNLYATGGVGVYSLSAQQTFVLQSVGIAGDEIDDTVSDRQSTQVGYKLGGGVRFGRGFSAEVGYYHFGELDNARYSGIGMMLGMRL